MSNRPWPSTRFNEAAGIHRRKPGRARRTSGSSPGFNEAAGIHRRKHGMERTLGVLEHPASMRPPEFTGGNKKAAADAKAKKAALQ